MMAEKTRKQRVTYLISRGFQLKFVGAFVMVLVILGLITHSLLYFVAGQEISGSLFDAHATLQHTWQLLFPTVLTMYLALILSGAAVSYALIVYLSHKIAGPLFRIEQDMKAVTNGKISTRIKLRATDQIQEIMGAFNKMADSMETRISSAKEIVNELELIGNRISVSDENSEDAESLKKEIQKLKNYLDEFN
jgi:methyl-accepting chemotaxis protein